MSTLPFPKLATTSSGPDAAGSMASPVWLPKPFAAVATLVPNAGAHARIVASRFAKMNSVWAPAAANPEVLLKTIPAGVPGFEMTSAFGVPSAA